jgi:hypothetical protein
LSDSIELSLPREQVFLKAQNALQIWNWISNLPFTRIQKEKHKILFEINHVHILGNLEFIVQNVDQISNHIFQLSIVSNSKNLDIICLKNHLSGIIKKYIIVDESYIPQ